MNICVIGIGYVGLVTGVCFADMGNRVYCYDIDESKINKLKKGIVPIYEPNLQKMVTANIDAKRLSFTSSLSKAMNNCLYCFIAVSTPPSGDGSADLSNVLNVAKAIGQQLKHYQLIVNKSTVPVGTAEKVRKEIHDQLEIRKESHLDFDVVSNPEFLKEGSAVDDFMCPDRIIIGADNERAIEFMKRLYSPIVNNQHPIYIMDIKSAEITKYAANAMLATRISFINEIAQLCDCLGGDISNVRLGIGSDTRIGMSFLNAGIGYGGSCFPKDVKALIKTGHDLGMPLNLISAVEIVNERQKHYVIDIIIKRFGEDLSGKIFGVWGLAFKPQTDDIRESPAIAVIKTLVMHGAKIIAYDPVAIEPTRQYFLEECNNNNVLFVDHLEKATLEIDALILVTEWSEFKQPNFDQLKQNMKTSVIFDGRNQYDPISLKTAGFEYYCVGRNCYAK